jgi:hypothetical protein
MSDTKAYIIMFAVSVLGIMAAEAVDTYSHVTVKRDMVVACYNAHQPNCQAIWDKEIK